MGNAIRLTVILFIISALAALAISLTYNSTSEKIKNQVAQDEKAALRSVFPEGVLIEERIGDAPLPQTYWVAQSQEGVNAGYAFKVAHRGYSSDIQSIVGVDTSGTILGIKILSQSETPGLGTRMIEVLSKAYVWTSLFAKRQYDNPWFQQQFIGLSAAKPIAIVTKSDEWHKRGEPDRQLLRSKNSVTAITGATISTRAVTMSIETTIPRYLQALKNEGQTIDVSSGN